ncbi:MULTISPECIES: chaperone NapD [Shewanella]|jgi:nitrate reductase NapD|uniref:Chaperone NapD n=3 Tax=Shewanella putrefaciens TaxID=24 RepID=E6XMA2_SHEP2|nr:MULTISPECIES: chaperone NapD [Shewanella]CAD6364906.1 Chaperone NapD [Shewanella hafniensis]ABM23647.1 NapD family protein [Shewanella sp. W3-18-1]AVV85390.1 sorbose reductase NapD family protein [Shewanella putrefaciens]MCA1898808.1 chaperone NapD [Shewanella putrefaciens]MCK7629119.1 chaperone NapD [Shewanella sp. JNE9-1]
MSQEYHITSLVVHAAPNALQQVEADISALLGCDIHAITPEGKLVVTLEGSSQKAILDNVEAINALSGVLSASLIYHQVEPLEQMSEEIL